MADKGTADADRARMASEGDRLENNAVMSARDNSCLPGLDMRLP